MNASEAGAGRCGYRSAVFEKLLKLMDFALKDFLVVGSNAIIDQTPEQSPGASQGILFPNLAFLIISAFDFVAIEFPVFPAALAYYGHDLLLQKRLACGAGVTSRLRLFAFRRVPKSIARLESRFLPIA